MKYLTPWYARFFLSALWVAAVLHMAIVIAAWAAALSARITSPHVTAGR